MFLKGFRGLILLADVGGGSITHSHAQGLLLSLYSRITPGGLRESQGRGEQGGNLVQLHTRWASYLLYYCSGSILLVSLLQFQDSTRLYNMFCCWAESSVLRTKLFPWLLIHSFPYTSLSFSHSLPSSLHSLMPFLLIHVISTVCGRKGLFSIPCSLHSNLFSLPPSSYFSSTCYYHMYPLCFKLLTPPFLQYIHTSSNLLVLCPLGS